MGSGPRDRDRGIQRDCESTHFIFLPCSKKGASAMRKANPGPLSQTLFICQVLYVTAVTLTKISIITSYIRVFPTTALHRLMYVTAGIVIIFWFCTVFVTIFQCNPVRGAWDFTLQEKTCIPILKFLYVAASFNLATDLLLCISPLPLCWRLRIGINERIALCLLFGVGFL